MNVKYVLTPRARNDVDDIDEYTFANWGAAQAEVYLRRLQQHIEAVALQPTAGRACPEYRRGYYKKKCGSHVVFYRIAGDGIEVIRILHESMDFGRHL